MPPGTIKTGQEAGIMKRKIIQIDEELCDGCGQCVPACEEGAIQIINGKARLVSEVYCDGLGACLGECPQGAIKVIEREARAFDEEAVKAHLEKQEKIQQVISEAKSACSSGGCPGTQARILKKEPTEDHSSSARATEAPSRLRQWPVQLHLVPPQAPFFADCDLLIAADCVLMAMGNFHEAMLKDKSVAMACPKLDDTGAYAEKLAAIFSLNNIRSITVAIMEVPCCRGLWMLVQQALTLSGCQIPVELAVISLQGEIKSRMALAAPAA